MKQWKCTVCGYIHSGESPPAKCPVCGADQSKFVLMDAEPVLKEHSTDAGSETKKWKCTVCGYVHTGDQPPEICPVCGADKSKFVLLEGTTDKKVNNQTTATPSGSDKTQDDRSPISLMAARLKLLTQLHGHPIAVHIPNGVLPLTVIFTFLAVAFNSEPLAIAAKLNIWFVALTMPAVLFSGVVDWHNRFAGNMSPVFKVKMICGGVVTSLTLILGLWWIVSPEIYLGDITSVGIFCLLNIANLIAAAVAGFYGGKLVFNAP